MSTIGTRRAFAAPLAVLALVLAGCDYSPTKVEKTNAEEPAPSSSTKAAECAPGTDATTSYEPSTDRAAAVRQLLNRGRLVVGVSADTFKLGWANPFEDSELQGFDIDVARAVADALGVTLQLRVISAADRLPLLGADPSKQKQEVDLVVRNMTMNCDRWSKIGFSGVYYNATQKVLVREDDVPAFQKDGLDSLAEKKVCAPKGSTSIDNIKAKQPKAISVEAPNHTGCLVKFQQGDVDAITGDDTVLAGLAAQDPYAEVPDQGSLEDEPYGVGANKDDVALIRFVNSVLDRRRANGEWQASYDKWLKPYLDEAKPPTPKYGR